MNPKKSAKPEPDVLVYDPSTSKGELRLIGESMSDDSESHSRQPGDKYVMAEKFELPANQEATECDD